MAAFFQQDLSTHAYSLGDLDDLCWPNTTYYGVFLEDELRHVTLLYRGAGLPVLLVLGSEGIFGDDYFHLLSPKLPNRFYAHFSPGIERFFQKDYQIIDHGEHYKMSLVEHGTLGKPGQHDIFRLNFNHLPELQDLYQRSYPEHSFDPKMLSTGKYFGCRSGGVLVSVAGVHVYSYRYRIAVLGNITTHPEHRNQGFARLITTHLCLDLLKEVDFIGLNVKGDNTPAINLYRSMGFEITSKYGEFSLKKRVLPLKFLKNREKQRTFKA